MEAGTRRADPQCVVSEEYSSWPDGVGVFTKRWIPNNQSVAPRALLVALHGFAEHTGRYNHVWPVFCERGIQVVGYDQRGFGRSGATHGDTTLDKSASDLEYIVARERTRLDDEAFAEVPMFVYAHSMGASIVFSLFASSKQSDTIAMIERDKIRGVICAAPWILRTKPPSPLVLKLAPWLLWLFPHAPFYKTINPDGLTSDDYIKESYRSDPLHDGNVYLKTVLEPLLAGYKLLDEDFKTWPRKLPILVSHGKDDPSTSSEASRVLIGKLESIDKELKLWPDMLHEGHNERPEIRAAFLEYSIRWIEARSSERSS